MHADIDVRLGPLELIIATPFLHHWHHSAEPGTRNTTMWAPCRPSTGCSARCTGPTDALRPTDATPRHRTTGTSPGASPRGPSK